MEPTPAAAGPPALGPQTIHNPAADPIPASNSSIQGFIRVVDKNSITLGYISGIRNTFETGLVISRDLAQVVHFRLHSLRLPVRQIPAHYRLKVMVRTLILISSKPMFDLSGRGGQTMEGLILVLG